MGAGSIEKSGIWDSSGIKDPRELERIPRVFPLLFHVFPSRRSWILQGEPGALSLFQDPGFSWDFPAGAQHTPLIPWEYYPG